MYYKIIILILTIFINTSCKKNKSTKDYELSVDNPTESIYDPSNYYANKGTYNQRYGILLRTMIKHDIKPNVSLQNKIDISFYNYGENLIINRNILPDIFHSDYSNCIILKIIEKDNITISSEYDSPNYGLWGNASIKYKNIHSQNVFISPLAMKHISNSNTHDKDILIFTRFINPNDNLYKDCVFLGDYTMSDIISNYYHAINTHSVIWAPSDYNWNPIQ